MSVVVLTSLVVGVITASINCNPIDDKADFRGCQLLVVSPTTVEELSFLRTLYTQEADGTEFWNFPSGPAPGPLSNATVMVCPGGTNFTETLRERGVGYTVQAEDLQRLVDEERLEHQLLGRFDKTDAFGSFALDQYHRLAEVDAFLDVAASEYPELMKVIVVGRTENGNPVKVVKLGEKSSVKKPSIWIDSGIHAREWVTIASSLYAIHRLLTSYNDSGDPRATDLLKTFDWHWMPVANPDGYEYSHRSNRFWRKNRSKRTSGCIGVDLNRNFDTDFEGVQTSSSNPCSQLYKGVHAFSEKESQMLRKYTTALKEDLRAFVTVHSYSQLWLLPYGYKTAKPKDYENLLSVAKSSTESLRAVHGTRYTSGSISDVLYATSGSSTDWAYDSLGVKYSYALELRDTGRYGFMLPRVQIIPTGEELFEGLATMAAEIARRETGSEGGTTAAA